MHKIKIITFLFAAIIAVSLPLYQIANFHILEKNGKEYILRVRGFDPYDPFRGNYIVLTPIIDKMPDFSVNLDKYRQKSLYFSLRTDSDGIAKINSISSSKPENEDYIKGKTSHDNTLYLPPQRFYVPAETGAVFDKFMEEGESSARRITIGMLIYKGESVINQIYVDGKPLNEMLSELKNSASEEKNGFMELLPPSETSNE